jgi:5'(3')-deoxyribonucleotidase
MRTIFLDMDGVVADFDTFVSNLLERPIGWNDSKQDLTTEEWAKLSSVNRLYYQLPLMPDATKLVAYVKSLSTRFNVQFLTAVPRRTTMPSARDDKQAWVDKYFPGMRMDIGPYSHHKQKWCKPGDILIDDRPSNIEQWSAVGGIAIYHTGDVDASIKELNRIISYI